MFLQITIPERSLMMKHRSLRTKISFTIVVIVMVALLLVSMIFLLSSRNITNTLIRTSQEMGQISREKSSSSMTELTQTRLQELAHGRATLADRMFLEFEQAVRTAASNAETIYEHAEMYAPRSVELPEMENDGILTVQALFASDTDPSDPRIIQELALLGNIQDTLYSINQNSANIASNYIATESGIMIQADYISAKKFNDKGEIMPLDAKQRAWYAGAKETGDTFLTPVIRDLHTPRLAVMCGVPIYCLDEFKGVAGAGMYLDDVEALVKDLGLGEMGEACVVNQFGQVLFSTYQENELSVFYQGQDLVTSHDPNLNTMAEKAIAHESGIIVLELNWIPRYVAYAPMETTGWSVFIVLPQEAVEAPTRQLENDLLQISEQAVQESDSQIRTAVFWLLIILAVAVLLSLLLSLFLSRRIVRPIQTLTDEVSRIGGDDLDFHLDLNTGDETQVLANSFESLTVRMKTYINDIQTITAEKERIGTELSLATRIQADMLPNIFPAFPDRTDFDIYASMDPAKEVGGDFYDFFLIDDDHLALVMADVSGKGIPAALFMMGSKILIQNQLMSGLSPAQVLETVNEQICANNREEMFVTVWIGILDLKTGQLTAANAGHENPTLKKPGGHFELIKDKHGFVVGGLPGMSYKDYTWQLEPGSKIFVYTDGLPEANELHNDLFGTDRMLKALRAAEDGSPEQILHAVDAAVSGFVGNAPQFDDLTMLCVQFNGPENGAVSVSEYRTTASAGNLDALNDFIEEKLEALSCPPKTIIQIRIAVDEIFSNIANYAYQEGNGPVAVLLEDSEEPRSVILRFTDSGKPFDPLSVPAPDLTLPPEERPVGGLGIYMVRKTMDRVSYEYRDGKNVLTIEKRF